jgi:hypothetical protein
MTLLEKKNHWLGLLLGVAVFLFGACQRNTDSGEKTGQGESVHCKSGVVLQFSGVVDSSVYLYTDYGEPPQIAIWLEYPDGRFYKTVFVTHRAGANDWVGKVDCPVALPVWESRQFGDKRGAEENRVLRAVTGATPKGGRFCVDVCVPRGSQWLYFLEVNVSGDFNAAFPYWSKTGNPDDVGNGQPSLVYGGKIVAKAGEESQPKLLGFTDQWTPVDTLCTDFSLLTTAPRLIRNMVVKTLKKE